MLSLSDNNQADMLKHLPLLQHNLLKIDNTYFEQMVSQIYPTEIQLNKANSSDTEALFLDLDLYITKCIVTSKRATCIEGQIWPPLEPKN